MLNRNKTYLKKETECIESILEIRLNEKTWNEITKVAKVKKKSYSWIVRYTVFRLINRKDPVKYIQGWDSNIRQIKFFKLNEKIKKDNLAISETCSEMHRHKLCLYGEDELLIRLCAAMLNCSMTHLVRLALEWYLSELGRVMPGKPGQFHQSAFYWLGIKLFKAVDLHSFNVSDKQLKLIRYEMSDYW